MGSWYLLPSSLVYSANGDSNDHSYSVLAVDSMHGREPRTDHFNMWLCSLGPCALLCAQDESRSSFILTWVPPMVTTDVYHVWPLSALSERGRVAEPSSVPSKIVKESGEKDKYWAKPYINMVRGALGCHWADSHHNQHLILQPEP